MIKHVTNLSLAPSSDTSGTTSLLLICLQYISGVFTMYCSAL